MFFDDLTFNKRPTQSMHERLHSNTGWVYSCVDLIGNRINGVPLKVYVRRKGKDRWVQDHPLQDLLDSPNKTFPRWQLFYYTSACLDLAGAAYWYIIPNALNLPLELWPLEPDKVEKNVKNGRVTYQYRKPEGPLNLPAERIVDISYPNATSLYEGYSRLQALGLTVPLSKLLEEYQHEMFKDGSWFPYGLSTDQQLTETQVEQVRQGWMQRLKSVKDKLVPMILHSGLQTVHSPSMLDLGLDELDANLRDKILAVFRIPRSKLHGDGTYDSGHIMDVEFNRDVILPRLCLIESAINMKLAPLYRDKIQVRFDSPVPADRENDRLDAEMMASTGLATPNEIREFLGKNPIEGGDEILKPKGYVTLGVSKVSAKKGHTVPLKRTLRHGLKPTGKRRYGA